MSRKVPFRKALDEEIRELTEAKGSANKKRKDVNQRIDRYIALLDERLDLAMRLSEAYDRNYPKGFLLRHAIVDRKIEVVWPSLPVTAYLVTTPSPRVEFVPPPTTKPQHTGIPDLTDAEWATVQPLLANSFGWNDRRLIAGILWAQRTGLGYRKIPGSDGRWTTFYNAYQRWRKRGLWPLIVEAIDGVAASSRTSRSAPQPPPQRPTEPIQPRSSKLTWADVDAIELPRTVNGHCLRLGSKKAEVIKAVIALLRKEKWAPRWEILSALQRLGIMPYDKEANNRLSQILTEAKGVFVNVRPEDVGVSGWSLANTGRKEDQHPAKH